MFIKYEQGESIPGVDKLPRFRDALGLDIETLIREVSDGSVPPSKTASEPSQIPLSFDDVTAIELEVRRKDADSLHYSFRFKEEAV